MIFIRKHLLRLQNNKYSILKKEPSGSFFYIIGNYNILLYFYDIKNKI